MSLGDRLRQLWGGPPRIRVRVFVKGRIGDGWRDVDRTFRMAPGATLGDLVRTADDHGYDLSGAIAASPHLKHTLMLNGERCPLDEHRDRLLADGDEVYLLAPIAGG